MLPISVFIHDSLTRLQQSNMNRLLRPRLEAAKAFTIRHWPKMMLVAINLPMLSFLYMLPSTSAELMTHWEAMKATVAAEEVKNLFFQNLFSFLQKIAGAVVALLLLTGADMLLDFYVLLTDSVRAAKLRRVTFWALNSVYFAGKMVVQLGGFSDADLSWWLCRWTNLDMLDGKSPEELALARLAFNASMTRQLAENAETLAKEAAAAAAAASWSGMIGQWAWNVWTNDWVQAAVVGWTLHVLIMDLQGVPRTWWGGRLQGEKRDEESALDTSDKKKRPSDL